MANYPSILQAYGSEVKGSDQTKLDRAVSGKPRLRTYYTQVRNTIKVIHDLDDTDMATLDAHYTADRLNAFTFTFDADSEAYTVRYMAAPRIKPKKGARWAVTVQLVVM